MNTDRPATKKTSEDWVISDKESLEAWVRRFLWHYEGVCSGSGPEEAPDNPEKLLVDSILNVANTSLKKLHRKHLTHLPDPSFYFRVDGDHQL